MKFSPKTILLLFAINILLALVCAYLLSPHYFFDDLHTLWQIPLFITIVSVAILIFSRIAETAINKPSKKYKIYFAGQFVITVLIFVTYTWSEIRSSDYERNRANIDHNEKFIDNFFGETNNWNDSMRIRALSQLEATCKNRNDLRLEFYNSVKRDTVIGDVRDSVLLIDFTYTHKEYPNITLCSKHMIGDATEEIIYYNIPASEVEAVQNYISEMGDKVLELSKYRRDDSMDKIERELLEGALKRIEQRKASRKEEIK